jgi:hypothetical protein
MARKPGSNDAAVSIRVPATWLKKADSYAELLSKQSMAKITRSDLLRAALQHGLHAISAKLSEVDPVEKPPAWLFPIKK